MLPKKECVHIAQILEQTKLALLKKEALKLKELSNQTIHNACSSQDSASTTIAVMLYALSKIIERGDYKKIKSWEILLKKFNSVLDLAIKSLKEYKQDLYMKYIQQARQVLTTQSVSIKPYIQEVMNKASINKGAKLHEHGLSLEQTSRLLGVSQWELSDYIGQKSNRIAPFNESINIQTRAKAALEFFS